MGHPIDLDHVVVIVRLVPEGVTVVRPELQARSTTVTAALICKR
jgi:hypothetical protein